MTTNQWSNSPRPNDRGLSLPGGCQLFQHLYIEIELFNFCWLYNAEIGVSHGRLELVYHSTGCNFTWNESLFDWCLCDPGADLGNGGFL